MAIKTPLSPAKIKNHFIYGYWKYLLLIILAVFGWNLIYQTTEYRPPQEKRIDLYVASNTVNIEALQAWMEESRLQAFPDMELIDAYTVMADSEDPYAQMQLSTFIMAGEGDIYLLDKERFRNFAAQGAMVPLESYLETGEIDPSGIDLSNGYVTITETGERLLLGIPADNLYGLLTRFNIDCRNMVLGIMVRNENEANVVKFVDYLIYHMQEPAPDWLTSKTTQP